MAPDRPTFRSLASMTQGVLYHFTFSQIPWANHDAAADGSPTMLISRTSSGALSSSTTGSLLVAADSSRTTHAMKVTLLTSKRTIVSSVAVLLGPHSFDVAWAPNRLTLLLKLLRSLRRETPVSRLLAKSIAVLIANQCATIPFRKQPLRMQSGTQ